MCDLFNSFLSDVTSGAFSTLLAAGIILFAYAHQRAARLRNALHSIQRGMVALVESNADSDGQHAQEILELLNILKRELVRVDENILCLQVGKELEVKRLCHQTEVWSNRLSKSATEAIDLIIKIRLKEINAPEYKEMRQFLTSLGAYADRLSVWSFFEW